MTVPTNLSHKPVISCEYIVDSYNDAKYLSLGFAQYHHEMASVKIFRKSPSGRWSRQSEEMPTYRLLDLTAFFLNALKILQTHNDELSQSYLGKISTIDQDKIEKLRNAIDDEKKLYRRAITEIKQILNEIDLDKI